MRSEDQESVISSPVSAESTAHPPADQGELQLDRLLKEKSTQQEQLLRTAAELENLRKRSTRELADAQRQGQAAVIRELVPVLDNIERAIRHADDGPLTAGVRMVEKQFLGALERFTVTRFKVEPGSAFDPSLHHAVDQVETTELEPGSIAQEFAAGYMQGNRLLRPAMVSVAKKPAGPAGEGTNDEEP
jgi:molecular chaperone GrpE